MFPAAIIFKDVTARARREFARYPHAELIWITQDEAKFAFGWNTDKTDIELIEFVPARRAEPQMA